MSSIYSRIPTNYAAAFAMLKGKDERNLGANTHLVQYTSNGDIVVLYHNTTIVLFTPDGRVRLSTGGYRTSTTKRRINAALRNIGVRVVQRDFTWWIEGLANRVLFSDYITLTTAGPEVTTCAA